MSRKDIGALLDKVREQNFTVRLAKSGHFRVTSPDGETVTVSASPRSPRALRDVRADLRRLGAAL